MQTNRHAVVIGASIAGLATARVLAEHFDNVTVLERDHPPAGAEVRRAVPQGRHVHALLGGGVLAIERLFPGIVQQLEAAGAAFVDFNEGSWYQAGGYRAGCTVDRTVVGATRPLIEATLRSRVESLASVRTLRGASVSELATEDGRVTGVRVLDVEGSHLLEADLVVDCSGRTSRAVDWLAQLGYRRPPVSEVRCDIRYATMVMPRRTGDIDSTFAVSIGAPPHDGRTGVAIPIERDRWMVTISTRHEAGLPADAKAFTTLAASLPSPEIHAIVSAAARPDDPVATHRFGSSVWRRFDRVRRLPSGFVALGDAVCSFNPVYGQGMSSALLQAVELDTCLRCVGNTDRLPRAFARRAAKVIANPWQIAVGADFAYPQCTGDKPLGTDLVNRYLERVLVAAQASPEVNTAVVMVQNLLASPSTLMRPSMVRRVLRAAKQAERARRTAAVADAAVAPRRPVHAGA